MWTSVRQLADAIYNDITSGIRGYHLNISISLELLEAEIILMRLLIIKEYLLKGNLPIEELTYSLNCIPVDCDTLDKCKCNGTTCGKPTAHFQIPQPLFDFGLDKAIQYIGSSDRLHPFVVYNRPLELVKTMLKYRKRGKGKPWVYVDNTPSTSGLIDCYIFDAPLIKLVSVVAIFKDPRLLEDYNCGCLEETQSVDMNISFIDAVIKDRLTKLKLQYYRLYLMPLKPNDQTYQP